MALTTAPSSLAAGTAGPAGSAEASQRSIDRAGANLAGLPLAFEENRGQFTDDVQYLARPATGAVALTDDGARWSLGEPAHRVEMRWTGPDAQPSTAEGADRLDGERQYFTGARSNWVTDVPRYARVLYEDVYPGTDLVFREGPGNRMEYDFELEPGASPDAVRLTFEGAEPRVAQDGKLVLEAPDTRETLLKQRPPVAYQPGPDGRDRVPAEFQVTPEGTVGFALGSYDEERPLVIDPVVELDAGTYYGGSDWDEVRDVEVGPNGHVYVAGTTQSTDFQATDDHTAQEDHPEYAFIVKLSPTLDSLVFSAILGGGDELMFEQGLAVDGNGHAYVTGRTFASDYPADHVYGSWDGSCAAYLGEVTADGSTLHYSAILDADSDCTTGRGIDVDTDGRIFVAGGAEQNLQAYTTSDAVQPDPADDNDGMLARIETDGSLGYLTYLGGSNFDQAKDVSVTDGTNVLVAGFTKSDSFATSPLDEIGNSDLQSDGFALELTNAGSSYDWFTMLGGASDDFALGAHLDGEDNSFVVGGTSSSNFPTANAYQSGNAGSRDAFLAKINPSGTAFEYSTYLGGGGFDQGYGIALDPTGHPVVGGQTHSGDFPTANAVQGDDGGADSFATRFAPGAQSVKFSTYLSGSVNEGEGAFVAAQDANHLVLTVPTKSSDMFTSSDAVQTTTNGDLEPHVTRLALPLPSAPRDPSAATGSDRGEIDLSWTEPERSGTAPIDAYRVYRGTSSDDLSQVAEVTGLSYTDTGLENGKVYYYQFTAVNANGEGPASPVVSAETRAVPDAPTNLSAVQGDQPGEIDLTWDEAEVNDPNTGGEVTAYRIYRGPSADDLTQVAEVGDQLGYTDTGLADDTRYVYAVTAVNDAGESAQSTPDDGRTAARPTAPTNSSADQADQAGAIDLAWDPPEDDGGLNLTGYTVYRATGDANFSKIVDLGTQLTYTDEGLADNTTYRYQVSAVNAVGEGANSSTVEATTASRPTPPQNVDATRGDAAGEIDVCWDPPLDDGGLPVDVYRVYAGPNETSLEHKTTVESTCWTHGGLPAGTRVYYRVTAVNDVGESDRSELDDAVSPDVPSTPQGLQATRGDEAGELLVDWTPPEDDGGLAVESYRLYRGPTTDDLTLYRDTGSTGWTDTGLPDDTRKCYAVAAVNGAGEGPRTAPDCARTAGPPTPPRSPEAHPGPEADRITLAWEPPVDDGGLPVETYEIAVAHEPDGPTVRTVRPGTATTWSDHEVPDDALRCYTVTAVNDAGTSSPSPEVCARGPSKPSAVRNLTARPADTRMAVDLAWEPPADTGELPLVNYTLYRTTTNGTAWEPIADLSPDRTHYVDDQRLPGVRYWYRIEATNAEGPGPPSDQASARASTLIPSLETPVGQLGDPDADYIPRAAENGTCGRGLVRLLMDAAEIVGGTEWLGDCRQRDDGGWEYEQPTWHDGDGDGIPDTLEFVICNTVERDGTTRDGVCVDRNGDGIPEDYGAPH